MGQMKLSTGAAVGSNGSAVTPSCISSVRAIGLVYGVYVKYNSCPSSTVTTIKTSGANCPSYTLLTLSTTNTSGYRNVLTPQIQPDGSGTQDVASAFALYTWPFYVDDTIEITVTAANSGSTVDVYLFLGDD